MFRYLVILAILPILISGGRVPFSECEDGGPMPNWVEIDGCDMNQCQVYRNQYVRLSGELTVTEPADTLTVTLTAFWLLLRIDMPLPADVANGCNSVPSCPITVGETIPVATSFSIESPDILVGASPHIELAAYSNTGRRVLCARVLITLSG